MTASIRVASIQHYPAFGGPYNEILTQERLFRAAGFETVVLMTDEVGDARGRIQDHVQVEAMKMGRLHNTKNPLRHAQSIFSMIGDVRRLRRAIEETDAQLVRVHGAHNPQGAFAARLAGVPIVWVLSSDAGPSAIRSAGTYLVRRLADAVLLNGPSLIDAYPMLRGMQDRVFPYRSPVDLERFRPATAALRLEVRRELGLGSSRYVVGTVANLTPQKDIDLFVDVANAVAKRRSDASFVVVGGASARHRAYAERVQERARHVGLDEGRLVFTGPRSDVARMLAAMDVKVITSRFEGTTTTAIEAAACSVPVISTDVGAVRDVVRTGENGFVVPSRRPEAFAEIIDRLLSEEALRAAMGRKGRDSVAHSISAEDSARMQIRAYQYALAGARDTGAWRRSPADAVR